MSVKIGEEPKPHVMCYSHFGVEVRNGAISITQWGFINDHYKVNPVGQWRKILVKAMEFVDHLGLRRSLLDYSVVKAYGREMIVIGNALSMQILALS